LSVCKNDARHLNIRRTNIKKERNIHIYYTQYTTHILYAKLDKFVGQGDEFHAIGKEGGDKLVGVGNTNLRFVVGSLVEECCGDHADVVDGFSCISTMGNRERMGFDGIYFNGPGDDSWDQ